MKKKCSMNRYFEDIKSKPDRLVMQKQLENALNTEKASVRYFWQMLKSEKVFFDIMDVIGKNVFYKCSKSHWAQKCWDSAEFVFKYCLESSEQYIIPNLNTMLSKIFLDSSLSIENIHYQADFLFKGKHTSISSSTF